ncbi:MAG: T9SS type A sorting domain-containing protein [Draconibacterium sp.]|nr:T9SS type A sorting domain-containing protein [Draconibacterium sp.]
MVAIPYDSTYTEPALFAGLQSTNDTFASTLRYSKTVDSRFEIIKHREISGGESAMQTDDFGWMVIDFAADQPDVETGINDLSLRRSLEFYPNPAKQVVHFNFDEPTLVEVFDLTGQKQLESVVSKTLIISSLSAGSYILKAEGKLPAKLISLK